MGHWWNEVFEDSSSDDSPKTEVDPLSAEQRHAIDRDGWIYDLDTGEVVGRVDADDRFEVRSDDAAEWVLELRSKLEGEVIAIDARRKALNAMLDLQRADKIRRLSWWQWRFAPSLTEYARSKLEGKARTALFAWGKVAFRKTAGTNKITDMIRAVEWVKEWRPAKVKVIECVSVKTILEEMDLTEAALGERPDVSDFLEQTGPSESVNITTGIKLEETT